MATDSGTGLAQQRPAGGPPRDTQAEYADVRHRIHELVGWLIDPGSTVAVVCNSDQAEWPCCGGATCCDGQHTRQKKHQARVVSL
jgi:hypothetical protein